jgi:undecaprenyl pyrophosphate phosphatase UppP
VKSSHLGLMVMFALFVSVVFGTLMRDEPKDQLYFGAQLFVAFVLGGVALGWVLYFFPL